MSTLTFDVLWRDRGAAKGMKSLGDQTEKTNKQFTAFGKIATASALVAGAALIKFGKDSVKAYSEAQTSQAKLQDAFARFPKLADTNIEALRGLNSELAKKTRFDDDATASGQAVLAQFQLTGQEITQLTPLLQDYAAKTGRDLPDAAKVLGKAMLGNGRALKDVGINFKDTGDRGKNFEQIMGGLRTQVGGFAEVEGKTAAGQLEILKNQFGELQEEAGSRLLPTLSKIVGVATDVVVAFGELSPGVKGAIGGFAVAAPTLILAAAGIVKVASAAKAAKVALAGMSAAAKAATLAAAGVGAALGVAAIAFGAWASKNAEAKEATKSLRDELVASNGVINESIRLGKIKELQDTGQAKAAENLGISLDLLTRAHLGDAAAMAEVNRITDAAIEAGTKHINTSRGMITTTTTHATAAKKLQEDLAAGNITLEEAQKQALELAAANKAGGAAMEGMEKKTKDSGDALDVWRTKTLKAASAALQLEGSQDSVEAAVDDATQSVKDNGKTLDNNTEKGRANRTALRNLATASNTYREQLIKQGASTRKVDKETDDARKTFIAIGRRMGLTKDEAQKLADKFGLLKTRIDKVPKNPSIKLTAKFNASASKAAIEMLKFVPGSQGSGFANALAGRASGGPIPGWSPHPKADNIPIWATAGEYMQQKKAVDYYGKPFMDALNQRRVPKEIAQSTAHELPPPGYALGGALPDVGGYGKDARTANNRAATLAWQNGYNLANKAYAAAVAAGAGGPAGSAIASGGWASIYRVLRAAGARSFTTYAGHDQGASRSRDIWPPSQRIADTARRLSSIWYVIYNRRIASKRHGNTWRPYTRSNPHTDHVHVTLNPGVRADMGGMLASGGTASNMSGNLERVLSPAQTKSFDHLVKVISNNRPNTGRAAAAMPDEPLELSDRTIRKIGDRMGQAVLAGIGSAAAANTRAAGLYSRGG